VQLKIRRGTALSVGFVMLAILFSQSQTAAVRAAGPRSTRVGSSASYVLYSVDQNGTGRQTVATVDPTLFDPVESGGLLGRSPNEKRVLVAGPRGVVLADVDGSNPVTLSAPAAAVSPRYASAAFAPDGSLVAFSVSSPTCTAPGFWHCSNLYLARSDGSDVRPLATDATLPSWSADGKWIAYDGELSANGDSGNIDIVHPDGSGLRVIASNISATRGALTFAPSGNRFAYACPTADGHGRLCIGRANGSAPTLRISTNLGGPLVWSPDGRKIAGSGALNLSSDVAVLTIATRRTRNLTQTPQVYIGIEDAPLAWSADSSRIAFQRTCDAGLFAGPLPKGACLTTVWAIGLAQRNARRLTHDDRLWSDVRWDGHRLTYFAATP